MSPRTVNLTALLALLLIVGCARPEQAGVPLEPSQVETTPATYNALRTRWNEVLTGGTTFNPTDSSIATRIEQNDVLAKELWDRLEKSPGRSHLWSDLASTSSSSQITASYDRLRNMTRAYATKGSSFRNDPKLKKDIIAALDWLYANRYNESAAPYGNWWDWEIGTPQTLLNIVVMLGEQLTGAQITNYMNAVERFSPTPYLHAGNGPTTGANRVWKANIVALRGVIVQDSAKIALARDSLSDVFEYVTSGDGFYQDGSFIQHGKHPYTGGYGVSLLNETANLMYLLSDSPWQVTDPKQENLYRWVHDAFEPLLYRGAMMDMVRGREIARSFAQDHATGHNAIRAIIRLSQVAPSSEAAALRSMVKYWITTDTYQDFFASSSVNMILLGREIVQSASSRGELVLHKRYPSMDRVVHRRPGFAFGLSMSSARIYNYESINNENLKGWYTADGMTYLYNDDLAQYSDDYWPTVNPYRLPGTTVDTQPREARSVPYAQDYLSSKRWVGGTDLLDYGVSGMELDAYGSSLTAKKSWFMFDDEVVSLGAGITSTDGRTVETTVENRKLSDANATIRVDGASSSFSQTMPGVTSLHLEGTGGYYFPGGSDLRGVREARTGAWRDINGSGSPNPITRNYATFWIDHGRSPTDASYSYVTLPNKSASETAAYSADPDIEVLSNTVVVQAVRETALGLVGANFWQAGRASYLQANTPASMLIEEDGDELTLSISDPTQVQSAVSLQLDKVGLRVLSQDSSVRVVSLAPIRLEVETFGTRGRSHQVKFAIDPDAAPPELPSAQLSPTDDAFVRGGSYAGTNYGSSNQLVVSSAGGDYTRQSFLKFDLEDLGGAVQSAKLYVYGAVTDSNGTIKDVNAHAVADTGWTETGVTWSAKPAVGAPLSTITFDSTYGWREFDVTSHVKVQQAQGGVASLALVQEGAGLYVNISSKENASSQPYLLLSYDPNEEVRETTTSDLAPSEDAYVRSGAYAADNYGAETGLFVSNSGGDYIRQSFIKFNVGSRAGEVASAKLYLYGAVTDSNGTRKDVSVYGVGDDTWTETSLSWSTKPTLDGLLSTVNLDNTFGWREFDVTPHVRTQTSDDGVVSLALAQEAPGLFVTFSSLQNTSNKPYLRLTTYR